jgi:hypothetical protein
LSDDRSPAPAAHPSTPDGRYFVVRGRLWRCANPKLPEGERAAAVNALMQARRGLRRSVVDPDARKAARAAVDAAKRALGERGPPWWSDGAPDYNRRLARNTPYAAWFAALEPKALAGDGATGESGALTTAHVDP